MLVAIAAMNALTGIAIAIVLGPVAIGADARTYRDCAAAAAQSGCAFMYPPSAAIVMQPLTWLSPQLAALVMSAIGLTLLVAGVALETRDRAVVDRVLVFIAVLGFAPVAYELLLGQVTLLIAATIYPIARSRDGWRTGLLFGLALAIAPKPMLGPLLLWMLLWRRRALAASVGVAALVTVVGLVVAGPSQYRAWLDLLSGVGGASVAGTSAFSLHGNLSLWPLDPARVVLAVMFAVGALWAIVREPARGFVAALVAGLVLAPYTGLYALSILLLAVAPALAIAPRMTPILALVANPVIAMAGAFIPWAAAAMVSALPVLGRTGPTALIPAGAGSVSGGTAPDDPVVPVTGRTTSP
jgi:hypothetical protein